MPARSVTVRPLPGHSSRRDGKTWKESREWCSRQTWRTMRMVSPERIKTELGRMAMLYRQPLDKAQELPAMVLSWAELCRDLTNDEFIAAVKAHLRESKFFPCPADIVGQAERIRTEEARVRELHRSLPEADYSPEYFEHQQAKAREILDMLNAKMAVRQ